MMIFVSYNSRNYELAQALTVQIGMLGHDVWFEQKTIGGHVLWQQVFKSIKSCDLMVFVATEFSLKSHAQRLEYDYANALGKPILPVLLEDLDTLTFLPDLSTIPHVDYRQTQDALLHLETAFTNLPAVKPPLELIPLRPELVIPLGQLRDEVLNLPKNKAAQWAIFLQSERFSGTLRNLSRCRDDSASLSNPSERRRGSSFRDRENFQRHSQTAHLPQSVPPHPTGDA